jgi:hypothetical protein
MAKSILIDATLPAFGEPTVQRVLSGSFIRPGLPQPSRPGRRPDVRPFSNMPAFLPLHFLNPGRVLAMR